MLAPVATTKGGLHALSSCFLAIFLCPSPNSSYFFLSPWAFWPRKAACRKKHVQVFPHGILQVHSCAFHYSYSMSHACCCALLAVLALLQSLANSCCSRKSWSRADIMTRDFLSLLPHPSSLLSSQFPPISGCRSHLHYYFFSFFPLIGSWFSTLFSCFFMILLFYPHMT